MAITCVARHGSFEALGVSCILGSMLGSAVIRETRLVVSGNVDFVAAVWRFCSTTPPGGPWQP